MVEQVEKYDKQRSGSMQEAIRVHMKSQLQCEKDKLGMWQQLLEKLGGGGSVSA